MTIVRTLTISWAIRRTVYSGLSICCLLRPSSGEANAVFAICRRMLTQTTEVMGIRNVQTGNGIESEVPAPDSSKIDGELMDEVIVRGSIQMNKQMDEKKKKKERGVGHKKQKVWNPFTI